MNPVFSAYLDVLRLIAALIVFAHHAAYPKFDGNWISWLGGYGHEAVVVFFVLSGLVIAFVTDVRELSPQRYATSRLSRLWSVALPALIATVLMDYFGRLISSAPYSDVAFSTLGTMASALFINEFWFFSGKAGSNIPFWSLSYEAAYYSLWGVFMFAPKRWLWLAIGVALIGPKICLLAPAWIAGVVAYGMTQARRSTMINAAFMICGAASALGLAVGKFGNTYVTWRWKTIVGEDAFNAFGIHATSFVSDNLIAFALAMHLVGLSGLVSDAHIKPTIAQAVSRVSSATFPIYLFHYPALLFFSAVSLWWSGEIAGVIVGLASLFLGIVITPACESLRAALRASIGARIRSKWVR